MALVIFSGQMAQGLKVLTEQDVAPISPEIDPTEKKIVANLTYQTLSCFEGNNEVFLLPYFQRRNI